MKVIAKTSNEQFNITAGLAYEVAKEIMSPELGLMYQLVADDSGKPTNLRAGHFRLEEEGAGEEREASNTITSELIALHRNQYGHNRKLLLEEFQSILQRYNPPDSDQGITIGEIRDFIEEATEYMIAMMFHRNSLRYVGVPIDE